VSRAAIRVGCAGWAVPAADRAAFGDGESVLARYATVFDAVEINSSFYRSHSAATYRRWAQSVPARFRFSVKLPRTISHDARLQGAGALLDGFLEGVTALGTRLGGVLVQLPPSLAFDARVASTFLRMLRARHDGRVALEPRHRSWFEDRRAVDLLLRHRIARVAADPAPADGADEPGGWPGWRYFRWHGSPRMYYSGYDDAALASLAARVRGHHGAGESWIVFDNTAHGQATPNAIALRGLLASARPSKARRHA
jgi:uncharacterized protein YecE (DUF72 family)